MIKYIIILLAILSVNATDLDTNTIEILVIEKTYEFGWPKLDTVHSIIHIPSGRGYHVHCDNEDFFSNSKPIILMRYKRLTINK